jgi:HEAT repeat protein
MHRLTSPIFLANRLRRTAFGAAFGFATGSMFVFAIVLTSPPHASGSPLIGTVCIVTVTTALGFVCGLLSPEVTEIAPPYPWGRVRHIMPFLQTNDPTVRSQAARRLQEMGPAASSAVPALIAALQDPYDGVRRSAADALCAIGHSAIPAAPALIQCLTDESPMVADAAERALCTFGSTAVARASIGALEAMDPYDRKTAAKRLELVGVHVQVELPPIVAALDPTCKAAPAEQLGNFTPEEFAAVISRYRNAWLRAKAVSALGRMGPRAAVAVPVLSEVIRRENYTWRHYFLVEVAIEAIAKIDPSAAVPELLAVVMQGERRILDGSVSLRVLGNLGSAAVSAVPALRKQMQSSQGERSHLLALALWQIGARDPDVAEQLAAALRLEH